MPPLASIAIHMIPITCIFTDNCRRFTPRSCSGNQYIMVAIHSNFNAILIPPFASKHNSHCIATYTDLYNHINTAHCTSALHILDNKVSAAFQRAISTNNCTFQLVL